MDAEKSTTVYSTNMIDEILKHYVLKQEINEVNGLFPLQIEIEGLKKSIKSLNKNTTITHYAPIDDGDISEFVVGKPVFMSGYVYKQEGNEWIESTKNDTQDCICSVKSSGSWREYVGVIVSVDADKECLTFATHGDYLFRVDDSSKYNIGDTVLYDGTIVNEDTCITLKLQRSTVGIVSGKIDKYTISVFKS